MLCLQHFCNKFKIIGCYWWIENNFSGTFKLEPVKTYNLDFVTKVLQKYCGHNTSQKLLKQTY